MEPVEREVLGYVSKVGMKGEERSSRTKNGERRGWKKGQSLAQVRRKARHGFC